MATLIATCGGWLPGQTKLTVKQAVEWAVRHNPELAVEQAARDSATAGVLQAQGAFDPLFRLDASRRASRNPAASILEGAGGRVDAKEWRHGASIGQRLPWQGVRWEAAFESIRSSSTNPFNTFNPFYTPRATLGLMIPLLRFRATDAERNLLLVRQRESKLTDEQFEAKLIVLVAQVEAAYWEWVAACDAATNARELLVLAEAAGESTRRQINEGEMAASEWAGARVVIERRREALAGAEAQQEQAVHALRMLITPDARSVLWQTPLEPAERAAMAISDDESTSVERALRLRPELRAADLQREAAQLERRLAAELRKPAVDLNVSFVSQGLAGKPAVANGLDLLGFPAAEVPPLLVGGLARGTRHVFENRFPVFQAGLTIELPLRNRAAEGQARQAELAERRARLMRLQVEKLVALEVRQAFAALRAMHARINSAQAAAQAAEERLASEMRLFKEGQSNNLALNVRQNELAETRQLVLAARRASNLSLVEARRATAQSLAVYGVKPQ